MAINYANLFEDLGEFIECINLFRTWTSTTIPAQILEIETELAANGRYDILGSMPAQFDGFKDSITGFADAVANKAKERMQHRDTILKELPLLSNPDFNTVMSEFIRQMKADAESVDASAVTLGTSTAASGNVGDAQLIKSKILDGYSSPWPQDGYIAHYKYLGVDSELCVTSETMTLTCIQDSETDGATEGAETFQVRGGFKNQSPFDWRGEGSGEGPNIRMLNGDTTSYLANAEFETYTVANTPDSWTLVGTVGTHILADSSSPKRGTYSLKFAQSGATATISATQEFVQELVPLRAYAVGIWVKGQAGIAAGDLVIQCKGTGYTPGSTEKITMNSAALAAATGWTFQQFVFNAPANVPSDFALEIVVQNTLTAAKQVNFDGLAVGPLVWHGGVGMAIVAGASATCTLRNDRYTFTIANDDAGDFQTFSRRCFKAQLPSNAAGAETRADTLATD